MSLGPPFASGWNCTVKQFHFFVLDALAGAVVGVHLCHLAHLGGQLLAHDRIAVVLAGDKGAAGLKVGHRLVGTAVAVLQLHGLGTGCQCGQLVTQTDAKGGDVQFKDMLEVFDDLHRLGGVAGSVGQHDAVRVKSLDLLCRCKAGITVTLQPRLTRQRTMLRLQP